MVKKAGRDHNCNADQKLVKVEKKGRSMVLKETQRRHWATVAYLRSPASYSRTSVVLSHWQELEGSMASTQIAWWMPKGGILCCWLIISQKRKFDRSISVATYNPVL
jgi:hypothetical protein